MELLVAKKKGTQGSTVHKHESAYTPGVMSRKQLEDTTYRLTQRSIVAHAKALPEGGEDWATRAYSVARCLITGQPLSGLIRADDDMKRLVRDWVNEARTQTGLKPPSRGTKPKQGKKR
jgi:hypothetical protein